MTNEGYDAGLDALYKITEVETLLSKCNEISLTDISAEPGSDVGFGTGTNCDGTEKDSITISTNKLSSSISSLQIVAMSLTAKIAFSCGELAVCVELSRSVIKAVEGRADVDANVQADMSMMWALRGGAFLMMGKLSLS